MTLASQITRSPIAYLPDPAAEVEGLFADQPPEVRALLSGTAGCSPYLFGLMTRHQDWLRQALTQPVDQVMQGLFADVRGLEGGEVKPGLRLAKGRAALWIALADLSGAWPLEQVTGALTDLADLSIAVAQRSLLAAEVARNKMPGLTDADVETGGGMFVLAMGKQGAHELNYSSDIDLICLFDQDRFDPDTFYDIRAGFIRVTRRMAAMLSELTSEGYVFRTDLRLRPDPSVTPVCMAMEAAERYYESLGRTWERAAYIKARPAAGDIAAGQRFLRHISPFVWRKHLDFATIRDAHDMRIKIREHKGLHGAALEKHDMKLGQGGIREIEFFTQTRQLIAGGRDPDLRHRGTVPALAALSAKGWVAEEAAACLSAHYRAHREVEHRVQMIADAQTHALPGSDAGFDRLARFMGQGDTAAFRADLAARLREVSDLTEDFFDEDGRQPGTSVKVDLPDETAALMERWPTYPALRSERAVAIFDQLKPEILRRMQDTGAPSEAMVAFDGFLSGLPAGVQLFSLFRANPQLIDLIVDISATAPELARYLSRNSSVLDAVIGGDFFADWPGQAALMADLSGKLARVADYEGQLDTARRWNKEWHFRIGVHLLRGICDPDEASRQYADLASAAVGALWQPIVDQFATKHGPPPGKGAAVLGMGSLGARRLGPRSDLDLIVIYDADGVEASEGRRPLASRAYYARLTQALVTALTAPMAEGKLYEVDMRLRPSGNQGPVATSFAAFQTYQRNEAWTWEHLALTRARFVAGDTGLGKDVEAFRRQLLTEVGDRDKIGEGVRDMRRRLAEAKPAAGHLDAKRGPGRAQDIELLASAMALAAGCPDTGVRAQLAAGGAIGWLSEQQVSCLCSAYLFWRRVEMASKLLTDRIVTLDDLNAGGQAFFLRATAMENAKALEDRALQAQSDALTVIESVFKDEERPE